MAPLTEDENQDEGQEELRRRPPEETGDEREEAPDDDQPDVRVSEDNGRTAVEMRPSRREQREARRRQEMEGHFKEFSKPLNDQLEQMRSTMGQLTALLQNRQQPAQERRQETNEPDDYDRIISEQSGILRQMRVQGITEKQLEELERKYHKLGRELLDTTADRRVKAALEKYKPPTGPDAHEVQIRAKYSDVFGNDNARDYAWALFLQMRAKSVASGKPFDVADAHEKALTEAAYEFNLRRRPAPAPSKAQQARFGGSSSGATERATGKPRHELTKEEKTMAREMFSRQRDWSDEKKFAEWAKRMENDGYWESKDE